MAGRASIARHPVHPMLVVFPIGLWVFSLVCDLIFHWGAHVPFWKDVAFYTMVGGFIGALAAAGPGLADYLSIADRQVRRVGTAHLTLNLTVVVLYAINLWLRYYRSVPEAIGPVWLSVAALVLLVVSGWLGGEMVYVHGVGVEPTRPSGIEVTPGASRPTRVEERRPA